MEGVVGSGISGGSRNFLGGAHHVADPNFRLRICSLEGEKSIAKLDGSHGRIFPLDDGYTTVGHHRPTTALQSARLVSQA